MIRLSVLTAEGPLELLAPSALCNALRPGDWIAFSSTEGAEEKSVDKIVEKTGEEADSGASEGIPILAHLERIAPAPSPDPSGSGPDASGGSGCGGSGYNGDGDARRWQTPVSRGEGLAPERRMELLHYRHHIVREVRRWFDEREFLEVETPALVRAPSPEPVFEPVAVAGSPAAVISTTVNSNAVAGGYLATSPEFQLKRMLVGGFERIYRLGPAFRGAEVGAHHNPEFSLLEWYRAFEDSAALIEDLQSLLSHLADLPFLPPGTAARLRAAPYPVLTVAQCFRDHLGMDIAGAATADALRQAAAAAGVADWASLPSDYTGAFSALWIRFEEAFDPSPRFITEWPAPTASLARLKPGDPTVAERVELYAGGLELANGFAELTDPAEQRRRFEADLAQRTALGLPPVPLDEAFLAALEEGMPPAAGMALGVDRLVMLLTGATHIRDVLPFAWNER